MSDVRTPIPSNGGDWLPKFGGLWKSQIEILKDKFSASIEEVMFPGDDPTDVPVVYVKKDSIIEVLKFVKDEAQFQYNFLADYTAIDEEAQPRFEVVYNLFSHSKFSRIRFKVRCGENEEMPTLIPVWIGANWAEREIWDMFGIRFKDHPDLRRILMDQRWVGHPLRKDYPLRGYQVFTTPEPIDPKLLQD
ncbi:MAG: NADH-quinone oxidoreductase subunit C [Xanthomonadaceae bacterium]|nr:NADH-quinone oxidoreductase subunit C [Xanthomonadaceae bacterium]